MGGSSGAPTVAGPLALLTVIASWAFLLVVGWAVVFWPYVPDGFHFTSPRNGDFVDALYVSLVTLSTLGFGDITPSDSVLRVVAPLESLLGFGLLTASISWLLSIYPALARKRSLAYEIQLLHRAERETGTSLLDTDSETAEQAYAELTARLVAVERDLVTFSVTYYFAERDTRFALPASMPYLLELAERGRREDAPDRTRLRAAMLQDAIDDFAQTTVERFHGVGGKTTAEVLEAYAADHGRDPPAR